MNVTIQCDGDGTSPTTLTFTGTTFVVRQPSNKKWPYIDAPVRQVLWVEFQAKRLEVSLLVERGKKRLLSLVQITGSVEAQDVDTAITFSTSVMDAAYAGLERNRRLKILANPKSGKGKATVDYSKTVAPILKAAHCTVDVTFTTHQGHAIEIMKALNLDQYDAVVVMSGDGLIHEVINGFAEHPQAREALRMPIAPIPSGSGNALAVNVLGPQDGYNVSAAALNVVKGRLMAMDLCAISQGGKSSFSFLSQAVGMFANLDLGTEHLRFLGSNRFVLGYIYEALRKKPCPVKLSMKLVDSDRKRMLRNLHERQSRARAQFALEHDPLNMGPTTGSSDETLSNESTVQLSKSPGSPPAMLSAEEDGWVTFNEPLLYMYAGNGPWVSREFMQFPVAVSDDGLIDIVVQDCTATRWMLLRAIDGAEKGHTYWMSTQHYFKVLAYRIEPYSKGHLSVDGERYPFMRIEVESHRGAARVLSPYGFWQAEFSAPEDGTK